MTAASLFFPFLPRGRTQPLCILILLTASYSAFAHDPGLSSAQAVVTEGTLSIRLTLSDRDVRGLIDRDSLAASDDTTDEPAADSSDQVLESLGRELFVVRNGKTRFAARRAVIEAKTGEFVFFLEYDLLSVQTIEIVAAVLEHLPRGHRMYIALSQNGEDAGSRVLDAENDRVELPHEK